MYLHSCWPREWKCFHMTSRRPYWCSKPVLWELNLHSGWSREWKRSKRKQSTSATVAYVAGALKKWVQERTGHSDLDTSWIEIITWNHHVIFQIKSNVMSPNSLFINILMDQQRNDTKSNTHAKATPLMMVLNASRAWDGVRGGSLWLKEPVLN